MKKHLIIYSIWLMLVVAWNFGYSQASPFEDVLAAIVLAIFSVVSIHAFIHKKSPR